MNRHLCIHGHFYQPPRENPWLQAIEVEDSAYPYHDWNERIAAECYGPNAASRILDGEQRITQIVNNYSQISFNFGPTLLAWLEIHHPEIYRAVLDADQASRTRFSGHGSALMQPYNHTILPLSNRRDKQTQILWGVSDFEQRFGRPPRGAWLPETAVDLESLDLLAASGIRFTLLAPHQARRVRPKGRLKEGPPAEWREVGGGEIDTTVPYEVVLPSGRTIAVFFYDGSTSRAVAFESLLSSGERFANRLLSTVPGEPDRPRLAHIATDGETYGHHHRYGEMALSYAIHHIESNRLARLTNYGEFLAVHPPEQQVEIHENTAWSCAHGVDRWQSDCGCHTGGGQGWNQAWRAPLRLALDWLRDEVAPRFEKEAGRIFADPWAARDDYIFVTLNRAPENVAAFFGRHAGRRPDEPERVRALKLLEMQRHALLMYTSCGWFFNDLGGIETIQVLRYAGRVVQLAEQLFHEPIEAQFLRRLEKARSNVPEKGTGSDLFKRHVKPSLVDLPQVAAHYAVTALFEEYPNPARVYCYEAERQNGRTWRAGRSRLSIGRVRVTSELTGETDLLAYGVLHFGDHNLNAGVKPYVNREEHERLVAEGGGAFEHGDLAQVIRLLDRYFGDVSLSLRSLFREEQRRVLDLILASTLNETEDELRNVYLLHAPLMRFLNTLGTPLPNAFRAAAELVLNVDLRRSAESVPSDPDDVQRLLDEARALGVTLDTKGLSYALERALDRRLGLLIDNPEDPHLLRQVESIVALSRTLPFTIDLRRAQNRVYEMRQTQYPVQQQNALEGDAEAQSWVEGFRKVAEELLVRVE